MEDKPSRGEQLRIERLQKNKQRKQWMGLLLFGGLFIALGIGLIIPRFVFLYDNSTLFGICSIIGGGMIISGGILLPDRHTIEGDRALRKLGGTSRRTPAVIPLPMVLIVIGLGLVITGILKLIG